MEHNKNTCIEPTNISSSKFGVEYENQFVVLDDAKHVIGVDANDGNNLILEHIENKKADKFGWSQSSDDYFTTLFYEEDTGFLYNCDDYGDLYKYKVHIESKSCKKVKDFGNLWIGSIISSHRFLDFVFLGGSNSKIKVLDLSTGKLLPGHLETAIGYIYSLQVCVKSPNHIYLTVSGYYPDYSDKKTDLFDLTDLLNVDSVILQKYLL